MVQELAFDPGSWKRSPFPQSPGLLTSVVLRSLLGTPLVTHVGVRAQEKLDATLLEVVFLGAISRRAGGGGGLGEGLCA